MKYYVYTVSPNVEVFQKIVLFILKPVGIKYFKKAETSIHLEHHRVSVHEHICNSEMPYRDMDLKISLD